MKDLSTFQLLILLWSLRISMNVTEDTSNIDSEVAWIVDDIEGELKQRGEDPDSMVDALIATQRL